MTNYMLRAERASDIRASFKHDYMKDLDDLLWFSHPACRARIDRFYAKQVMLGFVLNTVEYLKERLTMNARNSAGFDTNMFVEKISYHRTAIRNLDRTIAYAQHIAAAQHMPTQQTSS